MKKKHEVQEEAWETPSLEWIHRVRREMRRERGDRPATPLPREEAERLANEYGLKLIRKTAAGP